jgi:hypothetical protein
MLSVRSLFQTLLYKYTVQNSAVHIHLHDLLESAL